MGFYTDDPRHVIIGTCEQCGTKSENVVDCRTGRCNGQFIICEGCEKAQYEKSGVTYCPKGCQGKTKSLFGKILNKIKKILKD
jgi:hypothetical protein